MPKGGKLDRCVKKVRSQGKSEKSAWKICNKTVKGGKKGGKKK